jgi:hypothetical protein
MSTKNISTKLIRPVAAAVAFAAGAMLFAAPDADARPRKGVEDAVTSAKADCLKEYRGRWTVDYVGSKINGYLCTWWSRTEKKQWGVFYDESLGWDQVICYRLDIEAPWICI